MDCLFCKVVAKTIPADLVHETPHTVAFRDIHPVAPTHVLVVPRKHISAVHDASDSDAELLGELVLAARHVARALGLETEGYRLVINDGEAAGQSVHHIHVHVLGGRAMTWPPG